MRSWFLVLVSVSVGVVVLELTTCCGATCSESGSCCARATLGHRLSHIGYGGYGGCGGCGGCGGHGSRVHGNDPDWLVRWIHGLQKRTTTRAKSAHTGMLLETGEEECLRNEKLKGGKRDEAESRQRAGNLVTDELDEVGGFRRNSAISRERVWCACVCVCVCVCVCDREREGEGVRECYLYVCMIGGTAIWSR